MSNRDSRNLIWDVFRGVAAIMVLLHHYTKRYDLLFGHVKPWTIRSSFDLGSWGVCVFFVLTGFFLLPSLLSSPDLGTYYKKRIIRLYPSYIPCVVLTWLLMMCTPPLGTRNVGLVAFLGNLTMFQSFLGFPNVDGAYWTLAVQLIIYITVGVLFFLLKKDIGKLLSFMFAWLLVGCCVWLLNNRLGITKLSFITDAKYIQLFIQGLLLYCIGAKHGKPIFLYPFLLLSVCYDLFWFPFSYFVFNLFLVLAMLVIQLRKLNLKRKGLFVFLGSISFPLYLLHQNIGYLIIRFMENNGLTNEFWIIIPTMLIIGLAWIVASFIEKPISRGIKRILIKQ